MRKNPSGWCYTIDPTSSHDWYTIWSELGYVWIAITAGLARGIIKNKSKHMLPFLVCYHLSFVVGCNVYDSDVWWYMGCMLMYDVWCICMYDVCMMLYDEINMYDVWWWWCMWCMMVYDVWCMYVDVTMYVYEMYDDVWWCKHKRNCSRTGGSHDAMTFLFLALHPYFKKTPRLHHYRACDLKENNASMTVLMASPLGSQRREPPKIYSYPNNKEGILWMWKD